MDKVNITEVHVYTEIWWHVYFHFFEALNFAFEVQNYQGFILHLSNDTDNL